MSAGRFWNGQESGGGLYSPDLDPPRPNPPRSFPGRGGCLVAALAGRLATLPGRGRLLYDGNRHRAVLSGGYNVNDTWVLDLGNPTTWELLPVRGALPLPRGETNAVYDPVNDRLWIWGGRHDSGAVYGEPAHLQFTNVPGDSATWVRFNPNRAPSNPDQPTPRFGSGTVYDPAGQRMIFYGGGYGNIGLTTSGTWALSLGAQPTWDQMPMGSPYQYGGNFSNLFIHPVLNRLVLYFTAASTNYWQFPVWFAQDIYTAPLDGSTGWILTPQAGGDSLQYYGRESCYHPLQDRIISLTDTYLGYYCEAAILGAVVFDGLGRRVRDLDSLQRPSGIGDLTWDGRNDRGHSVTPGVYFVRLSTVDGQGTSTVRVTRVR